MQRKPSVDTLLFIPDDILAVHLDDASLQVAESWAERPVRVAEGTSPEAPPVARSNALGQDRMLVLAACLALVGWGVCTGWWAWLAVDTGMTLWTGFAGVGAAVLVLGMVATARLAHAARRRRRASETAPQ